MWWKDKEYIERERTKEERLKWYLEWRGEEWSDSITREESLAAYRIIHGYYYIEWLPSPRTMALFDSMLVFEWIADILFDALLIYLDYGFKAALYSHFFVLYSFTFLMIWLLIVLAAAVLTLDERRWIAELQQRHGPAKVGFGGLLQPISDAFKMIFKEFIKPKHVKIKLFKISSTSSFVIASFFWTTVPYTGDLNIINNHYTILVFFLISLVHVYTVLLGGWSSNSKYSFLGCVRTVSQLISYDIAMIMLFVKLFAYFSTLDYHIWKYEQHEKGMLFVISFQSALQLFIIFLSETSRHPYDLPEAEAELVSGYNVEYGSIRFAMFFLAEYSTVIYFAVIYCIIFFNTPYTDFEFFFESFKLSLVILATIFCRALLPRYRYDQLMRSCWKTHIPAVCSSFTLHLILFFIS